MSETDPLPASAEPAAIDPDAARAERHARALTELAEIGLEIARALRSKVLAGPIECAEKAGAAFTQVAKSVRLTISLEATLAEEARVLVRRKTTDRQAAQTAALERAVAHEHARRRRNRDRVTDLVDAAIEAGDRPEQEQENLFVELNEWLEDEVEDADFGTVPVVTLVARICEALGITPDPELWRDADWLNEQPAAGLPDPLPPDSPALKRDWYVASG